MFVRRIWTSSHGGKIPHHFGGVGCNMIVERTRQRKNSRNVNEFGGKSRRWIDGYRNIGRGAE